MTMDSNKPERQYSPSKWASPLAQRPSDAAEPNPLAEIFDGNRAWVAAHEPGFFAASAKKQSPRYLWIGCSDSRVPAEEITGLPPGRLFVHRNIANMVVMTDANLLSVLEYSVKVLKVQDIIVCGHYGCGGIRAALDKCDSGVLGNWLCNIRDVHRTHHNQINELGDDQEKQLRLLVELNVREQCINLLKTATVQRSLLKTRRPRIHGIVYDLADGVIHELPIDFQTIADDLGEIYSLYT